MTALLEHFGSYWKKLGDALSTAASFSREEGYYGDADKLEELLKDLEGELNLVQNPPPKHTTKDIHTEHCCYHCGCKYGEDDCTVKTGLLKQAHPCGHMYTCPDVW